MTNPMVETSKTATRQSRSFSHGRFQRGRPIIRLSLEARRYRRSHRINFHTRPHGDDPRGTIRLLSRRNDGS